MEFVKCLKWKDGGCVLIVFARVVQFSSAGSHGLVVHTATSSVALDVFFFQAEDGIRDIGVTGVQTCALPISIDVEREPRQRQARQGVEYDLLIQPDQGSEPRVREPAQPVGDRARRRQPGQPAESADERVADEILQVLYPPRPDVEQRQQQQTQPRPAVVATEVGARAAQSWIQAEPAHVAMEQLEPAVRRQLLRHELDRQISLDHLPQAAYAQTYQRGLRERKSDVGTSALL